MTRVSLTALAVGMLVAVLAPAAGAQGTVAGADSLFPRIVYADALTSANDRCIVARSKLNRRVRPVYVNGAPIGFC